MNALLTTESPLVLLPSLAVEFGIVEAAFLQQLHYWQTKSDIKHAQKSWVYNTLEQWHSQLYCFSAATLKRAIAKLQKLGIVLVEKLAKHKSNRTNFYHLDHSKLAHIAEFSNSATEPKQHIKLTQSTAQNEPMHQPKMTQPSAQIDPIHQINLTQSIGSKCANGYTENTKENTKNTSKTKNANFENFAQPQPATTERQTESPTPPPSNPLATGGTTTPQHPEPTAEQLANLPAAQTQLLKNLRLLKIDIAHNDPNLTHWIGTGMVKHISQLAIQKSNGHWQTPAQLGLTKPKANRMGAAA